MNVIQRILFLACATVFPAHGQPNAEDVITDIDQLSSQLLGSTCPDIDFDLCGSVLHACTKARKYFYLTDGTNFVKLVDKAHWPKLPFKDGDVIRARGRTVRLSTDQKNANCLSINLLRHASPPAPQDMSIREAKSANNMSPRYIRVSGHVLDIIKDDIDPMYVNLVLSDGDARLLVAVRCHPNDRPQIGGLLDATVSVSGILSEHTSANANPKIGTRYLGQMLFAASLNAFQVVQPAPKSPADLPDIETLSPLRPEVIANAPRCKATGRVITVARPHGFLLKTDSGRIVNVDLADPSAPKTGDTVTAAGLPSTDLYRINLVKATWVSDHGLSQNKDEPPVAVTAESLLTDGKGHAEYKIELHGNLVKLNGIIRNLPSPNDHLPKIVLDCNGYAVDIVADPGTNPFDEVELGSVVEVTGICIIDVELWQPGRILPVVRGAAIAVRTSRDIRILVKPPWWTPSRLFILIALLIVAIVVIFIWNITLRTLVTRRSRELLREQARRLTETLRVEERTRLATELHDTVAQNLSGLSLQLDAAGRLADSNPTEMKAILALTSKALLACRRELRDCLWDLRSQALDEMDMNAAIRRVLTPRLGQTKLITRFNVPRRKIADHSVHAILRILGELANNAIQHGKAHTLRIAGSLDAEGIKFSCADDGCGFVIGEAPGSTTGHFGLQGIRDRIRTFNGSLQLTSTPGKGTYAVIHLNPAPYEN